MMDFEEQSPHDPPSRDFHPCNNPGPYLRYSMGECCGTANEDLAKDLAIAMRSVSEETTRTRRTIV